MGQCSSYTGLTTFSTKTQPQWNNQPSKISIHLIIKSSFALYNASNQHAEEDDEKRGVLSHSNRQHELNVI